jgi:hypothetical protein
VTFVTSNWIIYWTGYEVVKWMLGAVFAYAIAYLSWFLVRRRPARELGWEQAWWVAPYLSGIWIVSYFGPAGTMGGQGKLGFFTGMWILALFSLVILVLALKAGRSAAAAQACADRVKSLASSGADPLTGLEAVQTAS